MTLLNLHISSILDLFICETKTKIVKRILASFMPKLKEINEIIKNISLKSIFFLGKGLFNIFKFLYINSI